jgi:hypothetical protein
MYHSEKQDDYTPLEDGYQRYVRPVREQPKSMRVYTYRTPRGILILVSFVVFWELMKNGVHPLFALLLTILAALLTVIFS